MAEKDTKTPEDDPAKTPTNDGDKKPKAGEPDSKGTAPADAADDAPKKRAEKTFTKAELDAAVKKQLDDAQKKWESEKDLTEIERLKKENAEFREAVRMRDAKEEVVAALAASGANSPALAFEAMKAHLKFDDAGKLVNSKDLIESLKTSYPEQFGTPKPTDGIDGGKGKTETKTNLTPEKLAAMTPDEINALPWEEVSAVMSGKA